jgi:NAD(P)-dependent dehydrogenase (short-subunit alcohol dehydrogenase family)
MFDSDILAGDVAIVTGAGRNIGEEIALTYAEHGAKVVVVDKNEQRADSTVTQIEERGGEAI